MLQPPPATPRPGESPVARVTAGGVLRGCNCAWLLPSRVGPGPGSPGISLGDTRDTTGWTQLRAALVGGSTGTRDTSWIQATMSHSVIWQSCSIPLGVSFTRWTWDHCHSGDSARGSQHMTAHCARWVWDTVLGASPVLITASCQGSRSMSWEVRSPARGSPPGKQQSQPGLRVSVH